MINVTANLNELLEFRKNGVPEILVALKVDGNVITGSDTHFYTFIDYLARKLPAWQRENWDDARDIVSNSLSSQWLTDHGVEEGFLVDGKFLSREETLKFVRDRGLPTPLADDEARTWFDSQDIDYLGESTIWSMRESSEAESLAMVDELRALQSFGDGQLDIFLFGYGDMHVHLQTLRAERNAEPGLGTAFMQKLTRFADRYGVTLTLQTGEREPAYSKPKGGGLEDKVASLMRNNERWKRTTSSSRLKTFYRRFGFNMNAAKGRYDLRGNMFRLPKTMK